MPARPKSDDLQELADGCDLLILPTIPDVVSLQPMLATAGDLPSSSKKQYCQQCREPAVQRTSRAESSIVRSG